MKRVALLCCLVLSLTGCASTVDYSTVGGLPKCAFTEDTMSGGLLLMAQSVPSSPWLPCLRSVPVGWTFNGLDAVDGNAKFKLGSDREGPQPLTVLLTTSCQVRGATETPSERPGMKRYERVTRLTGGYAGERYYTFAGGCITYRFDLQGQSRAEPVAEISQALSVVSRKSVQDWVHEHSDGRLELDPTRSAAR